MKPVAEMTRLELACYVGAEFKRRTISVVLSGGSSVSIYSSEKHVSGDLDFVNTLFARRDVIIQAMAALGFSEKNRYFMHPDTQFFVEFPPGPLGVGEEQVKRIDEIQTTVGSVRIISPTDCVKDRLAWYYHSADRQCLQQAILVALTDSVDAQGYIKDMRRRDTELAKGWGQIATPLSIATAGGPQNLNCANTTEITRTRDSQGFSASKEAAHAGGTAAGNARRELEKKSGRKVVTNENYLVLLNGFVD